MLSEPERDAVRYGALAEELKAHPGWSAYVHAVSELRLVYLPQALAKGMTDYEKGAIFAMDLVLTCLDATIEAAVHCDAGLGAETAARSYHTATRPQPGQVRRAASYLYSLSFAWCDRRRH